MKIDVHNHVIPQAALDLLHHDDSYGVGFSGTTVLSSDGFQFPLAASFYDPKAKLQELADHGLDGAVISVAPPLFLYDAAFAKAERLCGAVNEGLARFAASAPERLRWMAHVPLQAPDEAVAMLRQAKTAGAVGVEIATNINGQRPDEPMFEPFWAAAEELKLLVMLHPYYNAPYPGLGEWYLQNVVGNPLETMIVGCRLICRGIFDRFPELDVLLVHGGGYLPYQLGRLRHAVTVRKELAGVAADPWACARRIKFESLTHDAEALAYLVDRVGAGNVFIGTDLPFDMAPPEPVTTLHHAVGPAAAKRIGETNPAAFFGFC